MFHRLALVITGRRRLVMAGAAILTIVAAVWGIGVFSRLSGGGFDDPAAESSRALAHLEETVGRSSADVLLIAEHPQLTVDQPAFRADLDQALTALPADKVVATASYWTTKAPTFVAKDGHETFVQVTLTGQLALNDDPEVLDSVRDSLTGKGYRVALGGASVVNADVNSRVSADIGRAESMSIPVLLILLVLIFGSVVSATLPLMVGGIAVVGSFAAMRIVSSFTPISVFAINVVTILGLGLAIDYGLLMVSRFREELAAGHSPTQAAVRTVQTAGRTIAVSALTVAVSLSGLLLFPLTFLRSMGIGGIAAVLIAAAAAVLLLPAVLAALGPRVDKLSIRRRRSRAAKQPTPAQAANSHDGGWAAFARAVMRRPIGYLLGGLAIAGVLAIPFFSVTFGGIDERVLPADAGPRVAGELLSQDFGIGTTDPIVVAADLAAPVASPDGQAALGALTAKLTAIPGVTGATPTGAAGNTVGIAVSYQGEALDPATNDIVKAIRSTPPAADVTQMLVGGPTAQLIDRLDSITSTLPLMALIVVGATFILLMLAFGSIVLPVKAIALNLVTLGATLGVVTWIFQDGHLSGLLGFTPTGFVEATQPILVLAIVFGLSMDYEVFLLSRIREQYDRTGDNTAAVAQGMQRTGRIITSAALLILVVIAAFTTSSVSFIKLIGVAMLVAIILDALLIRMIVVPAAMRLMGSANWWLPGPLARVYRRFGIHEEIDDAAGRPEHGADPEPATDDGMAEPAVMAAHRR